MRSFVVFLLAMIPPTLLGGCGLAGNGRETSQGTQLAGRVVEQFERNGYTVTVSYVDPYVLVADPSFASLARDAQAAAVREYAAYNVVYNVEITRGDGSSAGGVALSGDADADGPALGYRATTRRPTLTGFETTGGEPLALRGLRFETSDKPALTDEPSIPYADVRAALMPFIVRVTG